MTRALTQVEARFVEGGRIRVLSFTWQGRHYAVSSHGRQWDAADGRRLLVMTAGEQVFELVYEAQNGQWHIVRSPDAGPSAT